MTQRRLALVSTATLMLAGLVLLAQPPASAHNYFAFLDSYAGFTGESIEPRPMPPATDAEVDRLLQQLKDGNKSIRMIAAGALGQTRSPRAVQPLIGALKDRATFVPPVAALSLGMLKDKSAVEPLKKLAASEDPDGDFGRLYAWQALEMLGVRAVNPMMIDPMMRDDPTMRPVIDALSVGDRPGAVKALLKTFKGDNGEGSEYQQSRLLEEIVDASCLDVLLDTLKTGTQPAKCAAAGGLAVTDDPRAIDALIPIIADKASTCRKDALYGFADRESLDPRVLDAALSVAKDPDPDTRRAAIAALSSSKDDRAVTALCAALLDKDRDVWDLAIRSVLESEDKRAVDNLLIMLKSKDSEVVAYAAMALAVIGDPKAVDALIQALNRKDIDDGSTLGDIAKALGRTGEPRAIQPLAAVAPRIGSDVVLGLGHIKHPSAARAIFDLLRRSPRKIPEQLEAYSSALENIGDAAAAPALDALKDPNPQVRSIAVNVFLQAKDPKSVPLLMAALGENNASIRAGAALALGNQGDKQAVPKLQGLLKDASSKVRVAVTLALAELGDPGSCVMSSRLLESPDEGGGIPTSAYVQLIKALGEAKCKEAAGPLIGLLTGYLASINQSVFDGQPQYELINASVDSLTSITDRKFGHAYYRWMAWGCAEGIWEPSSDTDGAYQSESDGEYQE